jgi:hypothetical protein
MADDLFRADGAIVTFPTSKAFMGSELWVGFRPGRAGGNTAWVDERPRVLAQTSRESLPQFLGDAVFLVEVRSDLGIRGS